MPAAAIRQGAAAVAAVRSVLDEQLQGAEAAAAQLRTQVRAQ